MRAFGFRLSAFGLMSVALIAAPAAAAAADWPVYGHDLANTRSAGADGPSAAQAGSLKQAWTFNSSNGDFTGTPVVADGVLVAGTNLGTIYALDAVTGKLRWSHDVGSQINGSAAIDPRAPGGAAVYVPVARLSSPHLIALDLATGAVRWDTVLSREDGADVFGSPTYWNGTVYIGTSGPNSDESHARGSVVAINEASGAIRWQTFTVPPGHDGGAVWSTPAIDASNGRLYVGTGNAYHDPAADTTDSMMVLDAHSGAILAHYQSTPDDVWMMDAPFGGPDHDFGASANLITAPDGRKLVGEGNKDGTYFAADPAAMRPVWQTSIGPGSAIGGILASTAYDGTRMYGTDSLNGHVWALGRDGSVQWGSDDGGTLVFSPVAFGNGVLYTANPSGSLIARDAATGTVLGRMSLGAPTLGGISIVGGAVYVSVGTGPPPQPLPQVDESSFDGSGSIVAFGDTSRAGAAPAQPKPRKRASFALSVAPRSVDAGRTVVFRFRTRHGARPLAGVAVRLAGRKARTNRHGRAAMRVRLPRAGTYAVDAWRHGFGRTATTVEARGSNGQASPPPHAGAASFDGNCSFAGTIIFTPPLTNSPQDVQQRAELSGPCNGTFVDSAGHSHELNNATTYYHGIEQATGASCLAGTATGTVVLSFPDGQITTNFTERRAGATPVVELDGKSGGSAWGAAYPQSSQDPTTAVQDCNGTGMRQFAVNAYMQTTPSISG